MPLLGKLYGRPCPMTCIVCDWSKTMIIDSAVREAEPYHGQPESLLESDPSRLRVIVVFTNIEGTLASLKAAVALAAGLNAKIVLFVTEVVYFRYPLETPPVSADFFYRLCLALIDESQIDPDAVDIEIHFCREQVPCLQLSLKPHSLVVIGATKRGWWRREQKLKRALRELGHDVLLVTAESSLYRSHSLSVIHRLHESIAAGS